MWTNSFSQAFQHRASPPGWASDPKQRRARTVARLPRLIIILAALTTIGVGLLAAGCGGGLSEREVQLRVDEAVANAVADLPTLSVLRTQRLEVVDQDGNVRGLFSTLEGGRPSIILLDEQGDFRALLFLSSAGLPRLALVDQPLLALVDGAGEFRSVLRLDADGSPVWGLANAAGVFRAELQLAGDGSPSLLLKDEDEGVVWSAP